MVPSDVDEGLPTLTCLMASSARNPDGLGLITDDNPKFMHEAPRMAQFAAKHGGSWTFVHIYARGLRQGRFGERFFRRISSRISSSRG